MQMQSGNLRQKVNILQPATTQDAFGGLGEPDTFASNVWAEVKGLQGRELNAAQQIVAQVTHSIRIRYVSGVKGNMLVQFGSRIFNIEAVVNHDEQPRELHLLCIERN
jgi:SPP1 family predicted phage head-tail adaptor